MFNKNGEKIMPLRCIKILLSKTPQLILLNCTKKSYLTPELPKSPPLYY